MPSPCIYASALYICGIQGEVQDYGSRAELAERKLDTTQLFGLLYEKDERGDFAYKEDEDSEKECEYCAVNHCNPATVGTIV